MEKTMRAKVVFGLYGKKKMTIQPIPVFIIVNISAGAL